MTKSLILLVAMTVMPGCVCTTVDPGTRGVQVNLGEVYTQVLNEGFHTKSVFTSVEQISVRQSTETVKTSCFSSDLQQVEIHAKVMYRIPETMVVRIFKDYHGNPFESLIAPRVQESLKEVTANYTAEQLVKQREELKVKSLALAKAKVGDLLIIEDLVIENLDLSDQLEHAIEEKMVQQQEAAKAEFIKQKATIEAETAIVRAKGEAEAFRIRGDALRANPKVIEMSIVDKWNGKSPLVVGAGGGVNVLLPLDLKDESK